MNNSIHPSWYFVVDSITSMVSFFSIAYSQLSDTMPAKHRAASFGMYFGAFFGGIGLAPFFAVFFDSHLQVTMFSVLVRVVALLFAIVALPETLPPHVAARNKEQRYNESVRGSTAVSSRTWDYFGVVSIMLRPIREMWILGRNETLVLLTVGAFLSKLVLSADITLFFYYVETELGVRDSDVAGMMLVTGILGVLVQAVFLKYFISLLGERGLLVASYLTGIAHNLIYGLAPNKWVIYVGLCLSQLSNTSGPLLASLASRNVSDSEHGRIQGALFALAALAEGIGPVCFNFVYRNWHVFGRGTMFVVAAMLYGLGTVAVVLIPPKEESDSDNDDDEKETNESTTVPMLEER
jgi:DHA1 family tetracycline resistance protein-like MFS transporter